MNILPTITTKFQNWRDKVKEAKSLKLKEVSVFPTLLNLEERKELYRLLEGSCIEEIPFVHLRSDIELWELDYLTKKWQTKVFNTHGSRQFPIPQEWDKYRKMIYIENSYFPLEEKEVERFAGVCLDFAHLENRRIYYPEGYSNDIKVLEEYGCGCNHISPMKNWNFLNEKEEKKYPDPHILNNFTELDYLKQYPARYFSPFIALEMENTIAEQLKAKEYIINLLENKQ